MAETEAPATDPNEPDPKEAGLRRRAALRARREAVLRSGLFDEAWYLSHHPAARNSDLAPVDHYLSWGVAVRAAPGPLFDPEDFLRRAWRLVPGIDDPLGAFLEQTHHEARPLYRADESGAVPGRVSEPLRLLPALSRAPDLAVMVHAFHPDLFGEICDALRFVPGRYTLLVSITQAAHEAQIRDAVSKHGLPADLVVAVCANRGRNFGPMLVRFRHAIRAHEFVLHLHTKRSLYRFGGLDAWRTSLLRTLLPAQAVVRGFLQAFEDDPSLGILSPAPAEAVRPWTYSWLRNRDVAKVLFARLGLSGALPEDGFDFPAGGMFWARTQAIAPLLDHPWRDEDFPEEQGQTDGTIAHAIERSIILVAAKTGFGFREIDAVQGVMRLGWGSRNLDLYPEFDAADLTRELSASEIASFDVFDTLLTRLCLSPDAVQRFIGHAVARRFPAATGYVRRRRLAEQRARSLRADKEVDLAEIHAQFREDADEGWCEAALAFVEAEEIALDLRTLRPRHAVIAALRDAKEAGRRTILVSDSYLTRAQLDAMLERFGLASLADEIYLSSERRARKDRGDLWDLVRRSEPGALFHVGDNAHSDIQNTADRDLRHLHVLSPAALFRSHGLLPADCGDDLATDILLGPAAEFLFNSPWPESGAEHPVWLREPEEAGALLLGPLLFSFAAWLIRHPATRLVKRLLFVSREGYFLKRMVDAVVRESGRTDLPETLYFQCSRRAALAALQGCGLDVEAVLKGAGFNGSLQDFLLARIGFAANASLGFQRVKLSLPRDNELLRCTMDLLRDPIEAHGARAAQGLRAYAEAAGIGQGPSAFVDVGYSGTMQAALQRVTGVPLVGLYMGVSHAAAQVREAGGHAFGAFADGDVADFTGGFGLMLEAFLTAPHGQVVGYDTEATPPAPLFRSVGYSQTVFSQLERFYAGAERYALDMLRCWGADMLDLHYPPSAATAMLAALRNGRLRLDPLLTASLSVEDDFCGNGEIAVFRRNAGASS
ncbi:hypothetical protein NFI95_10870 [Acetobacteraceae bacterium KSS8]|uniref:Rhamnan synthesis protein F n=1 Tax=Endosaccharibacter trunci TaxID=2812733 RepID=A0ABT1W881_9PROT|nr:hypothetical protein [Acetobacteraceae bacterium KSS8]